jgi:hypothetical protein
MFGKYLDVWTWDGIMGGWRKLHNEYPRTVHEIQYLDD